MFKSAKHWFESLDREDHPVFHHADDKVLHVAMASLLFHIISADQKVSAKEQRFFVRILKEECGLSDEQARYLYQNARSLDSDIHDDLETIGRYLKNDPLLRKRFMDTLNQLIEFDWVKDREVEAFSEALQVFFPGIKDVQFNSLLAMPHRYVF